MSACPAVESQGAADASKTVMGPTSPAVNWRCYASRPCKLAERGDSSPVALKVGLSENPSRTNGHKIASDRHQVTAGRRAQILLGGADPNVALEIAVDRDELESLRMLLEFGAEPVSGGHSG